MIHKLITVQKKLDNFVLKNIDQFADIEIIVIFKILQKIKKLMVILAWHVQKPNIGYKDNVKMIKIKNYGQIVAK